MAQPDDLFSIYYIIRYSYNQLKDYLFEVNKVELLEWEQVVSGMKNLRMLREERKLSQQRLADEFELAQSQIHSYENGSYAPDIKTLNKYADFFDVSVDFLLGRTDIRQKAEPVRANDLNEAEQELLDEYRSLLPHQRRALHLFLDALGGKTERD